MKTDVVEIVKWKSKLGVADKDVIQAAEALIPDLHLIGGFVQKTLYKDNDQWIDIYYWETTEDAHLSNERMASKQSFLKLISLVLPESISISVMKKV